MPPELGAGVLYATVFYDSAVDMAQKLEEVEEQKKTRSLRRVLWGLETSSIRVQSEIPGISIEDLVKKSNLEPFDKWELVKVERSHSE